MKLLYTNFHDGDGGGHTTYVLGLAKALAHRHDVWIAAPATSRLLREAQALDGVRAVAQEFPNGLKRLPERLRAKRALRALLGDGKFDIVHVNGSADHRLVLSARHGTAWPKVVLTKHNSKPVHSIGHAWRARTGTDQVIAVSRYSLEALKQSPYRRCRLEMVHNGIDTAHFAPWPRDRVEAQRRQWLGDGGTLLLGSSAGTAAYKGWMDLVEAMALLPAPMRGQVRLVIAGKLPGTAQQERIAALGLASHVHFTGLVEDVRPVIAAIDVGFVLSFDVETISFACREMMAMGKPVLLSDYAGLPENIETGREGWLVPVQDPRAVADALQRIIEQRGTLPAMGAAARERAVAEFSRELFVERTEAVYRRLLQD